jgi:hypothetical protein
LTGRIGADFNSASRADDLDLIELLHALGEHSGGAAQKRNANHPDQRERPAQGSVVRH